MVLSLPPFRQVAHTRISKNRRQRLDYFCLVEIEIQSRWRPQKNVGEELSGPSFAEELRKKIAASAHRRTGQFYFLVTLLECGPDHLRAADRIRRIDSNLPLVF